MRSTTFRVARQLTCLLPAAVAFSHGAAPMTLAPASRLWVDGTSTVRAWSCRATQVDAAIETSGPGATAAVLQGDKAVTAVAVTIPVERLDCGNGTMNEHMRRALKAKDYATIAFTVTGYDVVKGATPGAGVSGMLRGQLTIAGVAKPIAIQAVGIAGPDGALHVTGSYAITMSEYQIKAPTLMLGAMKVGDQVKVSFDLFLQG